MSKDEILYHYCSNEVLIKILSGKQLRLSCLHSANDYMEGGWIIEKLKNELASGMDGFLSPDIDSKLNFYRENLLGFVSCFSKEEDLLSQWRGYGNNGKGVAVGFNRKKLDSTFSGFTFGKLVDVEYREREQDKFLKSWIRDAEKVMKKIKVGKANKDDSDNHIREFLEEIYSYKNPAFKEEREVRLIMLSPLEAAHSDLWGERVELSCKDDLITPYIDIGFSNLMMNLVEKIVIGPKNTSSQRQLEFWLKAKGYSKTEVCTSKATYR